MTNEMKFEEKYKNLKSKFMESVDLAFRLGFEQGQQKAQQDQMAQQQQQAEMQAAQQAQLQAGGGQPGGDPNAPPQDGPQDPNAPPAGPQGAPPPPGSGVPQENPMGSELDQHLAELESLLGKKEISQTDLKKTLHKIKGLRDMKKSQEALKGIALAMHTPKYKMSAQAQHNLTDTAKQSLQIQKRIVDDIFKSWDEEEKHASKSIGQTLEVEGLIKK